jgi:tetratricopeptide (TPR) repeat protein
MVAMLAAVVWTRNVRGDEAAKAFDAGKQAFSESRYDDASASFRRAFQLKPSWKIYFNIGQAEAAAKRYGAALEIFERYLAEGGDDIDAERQAEVLKENTRLRGIVGYVKVSAPTGAEISIDGTVREHFL